MKSILTSLLAISVSCLVSHAQSPAPDATPPVYHTVVIPVGKSSDSKWVGEGSKMRAVALDPGAAPPRPIYFFSSPSEFTSLGFALNSPTKRMPIPKNIFQLKVMTSPGNDQGEKPKFKVFSEIVLPEKIGSYSVFMSRAPGSKDWSKTRKMVLSDSISDFPESSIRFVNMAASSVAVKVGSAESKILKPGQHLIWSSTSPNSKVNIQIAYQTPKKVVLPCMNTQLKLTSKTRVNITTYATSDKIKTVAATSSKCPKTPVIVPDQSTSSQ